MFHSSSRLRAAVLSLVAFTLISSPVAARTKMVTLPDRDKIVIHLENPNAILIEEERVLTLQKGTNKIDFSWKGVQIDPASIQLYILEHPQDVRLIAFAYPPGEPAVVAEIYSENPVEEKMRIAYLLSGVDKEVSYLATAENDEKTMDFKNYLKIKNFSGEDFKGAHVVIGYGAEFDRDLQAGEQKKMLSYKSDKLPIKKTFTWDSQIQPHDPELEQRNVGIPMHYVIKNAKESNLGDSPLLYGKARLFQKDSKGVTAFIGEDWGKFTGVGDEMKLYLGDSRDISVKRKQMTDKKINLRKDYHGNEIMWDRTSDYVYEIENFKKQPAELTLVDHFDGYYEVEKPSAEFEKKDSKTLEFKIPLAAAEKKTVTFTVVTKNITNDGTIRDEE